MTFERGKQDGITVSDVKFSVARPEQIETGLLGWITCVLNQRIRLEGITLRRTKAGTRVLSFPIRTDRHGREHSIVRPVGDDARIEIERQVFAALGYAANSTSSA